MNKNTDDAFFRYIRDFLTIYLPKSRNCSVNTVKAYRESINLFRIFMDKKRNVPFIKLRFGLVNRNLIYEFLEWLKQARNCSVSTCNQRLAAMKSFFLYCSSRDPALCALYMDVQQIRALRSSKSGVAYFSQNTLKAILSQPDTRKRTELRNRFLMILMYDTGARVQEILNLRLRDFALDFDIPLVYLNGKGDKVRAIPLTNKTIAHLKKYLDVFHPDQQAEDSLFYTVIHGKRNDMSPDNVAAFLKRYAKEVRVSCPEAPNNIYPHMFRHSRAMHLYQSGIPLSYIKEFLGHVSVTTTNIYASADTMMIKSALEKVAKFSGTTDTTPAWEGDEDMILKLCGLV
jgi:site-specific recombinase XerD